VRERRESERVARVETSGGSGGVTGDAGQGGPGGMAGDGAGGEPDQVCDDHTLWLMDVGQHMTNAPAHARGWPEGLLSRGPSTRRGVA
jgi:hypothetical protein